VYLRVDYESNRFGLAHIKRDDPAGNPSLVRLGCDSYDGPNDGPLTTPSSSPTAQPSSSGGSNTGAIAGGVVGGLAGLAIIGIAALCFIRRRKKAAPVDNAAGQGMVYDQNKDQTTPNMAQYNSQNYEDPPAFSPTGTPAPYSPVGSPVYLAAGGVPRRPLPGQQYPGYYDNQGGYTEQAAELGGSDIVAASELSGRPRSTGYGQFAEGNMDDPAMGTGKR
jgi:LPXTG-motif cell wall-anchored protein